MLLYQNLSNMILDGLQIVNTQMGPGLLELCYHKALLFELKSQGLKVESEKGFKVTYKGHLVGLYYADLVVEGKIIIECKAVKVLSDLNRAQLINYLHISGLRVGYLVNFGRKYLDWQRLVV